MPNTALTDLISLLQASDSNSEPVTQGKGPVLQQTGSGVINVPQQSQQKQKTPLEQASDAIKVAKAYQDLQNTPSNFTFSAPEPDTNSYLSDAFANSNFGQQQPIFTGSADGALAMNAPQFNSDINYSNGFNYEPVASAPEDTQVVTQQATPEQNNPAQDNNNTITSIDGSSLPTLDLANTAPRDLPIEDMSASELAAYNIAQAKKAGEQARKDVRNKELQEARDYAKEYGVTDDGTPYRNVNGKAFPISKFSEKGKEIIARLSSPIMVAALAMSDPAAATPQDTDSVQEQQQTQDSALTNAGNAISKQNQQNTDNSKGELAKASKSSDEGFDPTGTIFEGSQPEFDAIKNMLNGIKTRKSGATLAELDDFYNSIHNIGQYAFDSFSTRNSMFGGGDNIAYAYKNAGANSAAVAKHVAESISLDPKETINVKTMIDELHAKYPTLPASAIGMVLSQNLISSEENQVWRAETTRGNISYLDSIDSTLAELANPNSKNNYASMKQDYARLQNMVQGLNSLSRKQDLATNAVNKQIQLYNIYKGNPKGKYAKETVDEANQDAYNYSADLAESAFKLFNKIYAASKE